MFEFVPWTEIGYWKVNIIGRQHCLQKEHGYGFYSNHAKVSVNYIDTGPIIVEARIYFIAQGTWSDLLHRGRTV